MRASGLLIALFCVVAAAPAYAAIAFVSDGGYGWSSGVPAVLTKPAGVATGDIMVMFPSIRSNDPAEVLTTPSGWTFITSAGPGNAGGVYTTLYCFVRIADASDVAASNYTVSGNAAGGYLIEGDIKDYSGGATSNPTNGSSTRIENDVVSVVLPAVTETFVSGEWYVVVAESVANDVPTSASPTLSHVLSANPGISGFYIGDLIPGSSPGSETFNYATAVSARLAIGVTIKPAGGSPAPPTTKHGLMQRGIGG